MLQPIKLITQADIQIIRAISDNVPADRLDPYILEAQEVDLYGLIGKDLYNMLFTQIVPNTFPATYEYPELKAEYGTYLAYMAYARFLTQQQVTVTAHSVVTKRNDFSDPVSDVAMQRTISAARATAQVYAERLIDFLDLNSETYPEWKRCIHSNSKTGNNTGTARITAVKGKDSSWRLR